MPKSLAEKKLEKLFFKNQKQAAEFRRQPVHVVYGGANLFTAETPQKLGKLALKSLETYAPNFAEFARAMNLEFSEKLLTAKSAVSKIEKELNSDAEKVKNKNFSAWFAWTIYNRTTEKLRREPIEDFRIDFEDGYGFRTDAEEDSHAISASNELAKSFLEKTITPFCGFRIKSFQKEAYKRALRTLDLFLNNLLEKTDGKIPENFCVNLPKITRSEEVEILSEVLADFEKKNHLAKNSIQIEIMIETPQAIFAENGELNLQKLVAAGSGRVSSAHFGAFDYTANFGITGEYQDLRHETCNLARQLMQIALAPRGIRLSDSVTIEMPVPIYKGENLTAKQISENRNAVYSAWQKHFSNVSFSLRNGFYQSWDLHPAQLVARYAAIYSFFIKTADSQAARLKGFIEKATQANLTGNTFDDAASVEGLLNFFRLAINCGAFREDEVKAMTGLGYKELQMNLISNSVN